MCLCVCVRERVSERERETESTGRGDKEREREAKGRGDKEREEKKKVRVSKVCEYALNCEWQASRRKKKCLNGIVGEIFFSHCFFHDRPLIPK